MEGIATQRHGTDKHVNQPGLSSRIGAQKNHLLAIAKRERDRRRHAAGGISRQTFCYIDDALLHILQYGSANLAIIRLFFGFLAAFFPAYRAYCLFLHTDPVIWHLIPSDV